VHQAGAELLDARAGSGRVVRHVVAVAGLLVGLDEHGHGVVLRGRALAVEGGLTPAVGVGRRRATATAGGLATTAAGLVGVAATGGQEQSADGDRGEHGSVPLELHEYPPFSRAGARRWGAASERDVRQARWTVCPVKVNVR